MKAFIFRLLAICPPLTVLLQFYYRVMLGGYSVYKRVKRNNGGIMLGTAMLGTGDYYLMGLYLKKWLTKDPNNKDLNGSLRSHTLITIGDAEHRVGEIFPWLNIIKIKSWAVPSDRFLVMLNIEQNNTQRSADYKLNEVNDSIYACDAKFFQVSSMSFGICGKNGNKYLQGYRGLTMTDYYNMTFGLKPNLYAPEFEVIVLPKPKTVLIAPYTTGNAKYAPRLEWWARLVERLQGGTESGDSVIEDIVSEVKNDKPVDCKTEARKSGVGSYVVLTNGSPPIPGTESVLIPYKNFVPYLDMCVAFIGVRSGLCEIVSSAKCAKIIIYTRQSEWYPEGMMLPYTGIENMGIGRALELLWEKNL